jgi:hypothetical protein
LLDQIMDEKPFRLRRIAITRSCLMGVEYQAKVPP